MRDPDWLTVVPCLKEGIGSETHENGLVSVIIPRFKKKWMVKLFLPKNKKNEIRANLDLNGTSVWNLIDGKKSIQDILDGLPVFSRNETDFSNRVIVFLQQLQRNGIISLYIPREV